MFVDRLAEMRRGVNQGLERARSGVDQFLHDERGGVRWNLEKWSLRKTLLVSGLAGFLLGVAAVETGVWLANSFTTVNLEPVEPSRIGEVAYGVVSGVLAALVAGVARSAHLPSSLRS